MDAGMASYVGAAGVGAAEGAGRLAARAAAIEVAAAIFGSIRRWGSKRQQEQRRGIDSLLKSGERAIGDGQSATGGGRKVYDRRRTPTSKMGELIQSPDSRFAQAL